MKAVVKIGIVVVLAGAVAGLIAMKTGRSKVTSPAAAEGAATAAAEAPVGPPGTKMDVPRLVDVGAGKCIPCKLMAPILDELREEFKGRLQVDFVDVWVNPEAGKPFNVEMIPTQIFYDRDGNELFRHTGFYGKEEILGKWKELGVDLSGGKAVPAQVVREAPVRPDTRPRELVCFMCDGDVHAKTRTVVKGQTEQRVFCGPHCYFIYLSSIPGANPKVEEPKVSVTDWATGNLTPASSASYVYGMDAKGRPTVKAFAEKDAATSEQKASSGTVVGWEMLSGKEMATRCAFCDRAVYPEDACRVKFGTTQGYGCCTHCAMGVAARLKQDIEVEAKDGFSGEMIRVKTLGGQVASIEPVTATAWFGQKKGADGNWVSAGCFKQGFFVSGANLEEWLQARPAMTGRQISIAQALGDKMKLSPEQIAKACKLGECK